ncbi:MAG: RNA methyltransferase [Muribaculaceae bacterium]|nr:RNA methyltransferase [Muribaculaceae bacterium]
MIREITDISTPELAVYASLTEAQLRNDLDPDNGIFIAESPKVIKVAIDAGYQPLSLLCERRHIDGDARDIIARFPEMPVYTGEREVLSALTGYTLTRGVLCAFRRPAPSDIQAICKDARRVVILEGVCDTTNIGAIFRSAAALGVDAVILSNDCCDPLNRRAVRVSMGSVFLVPWAKCANPEKTLQQSGFKTVAMALRNNSINLDSPQLKSTPKLAIIMGTEGEGLPTRIIDEADYVVKIPMAHGVDSLNVAAASAVAFWELCHVL